MKTGFFKKIGTAFVLTPALLVATLPAGAQDLHRRGDDRDQYQQQQRYQQQYQRQNDRRDARRDYRYNDRDRYRGTGYVTYAPAYRGGYEVAPAYGYGDQGYYQQDNGIGPGKGAAIGAISGVVLGALLGGGKGAVIGGAAGAGVGAIAGQAAQDNRRGRYGY